MIEKNYVIVDDIADGIHLTVTREGSVSLWDNENNAKKILNREEHEQYLRLELTRVQYDLIDKARATADRLYRDIVVVSNTLKTGAIMTIDGYEVLARIDPVDEEVGGQVVVVSNNSDHVLVFQRRYADSDQYAYLMSWKYTDTAFQVAYAAALSFAVNHAGAVIHKG